MNKKLIIAGILALVASYAGLRPSAEHGPRQQPSPSQQQHTQQQTGQDALQADASQTDDINELTQQHRVANYLQQHQRLPDYYMRKSEARRQGWDPSRGNLCQVLPGRAIGGDRFSNREGGLPEKAGRKWFEADVNYQCGRRGSDRMLWSSDGLIYVTRDHYRHFEQVN
ncbi:ribonuclease domain-containing protein [Erwinia sp. JUb26]|uniref:ribonuclease domain-containing protein n=1 Tax=Erwinia sp. JUb26 TaxID=2485126 RepID=UPI000F4ABBAD|nr:ribonuclease domain-containing protein [Erwinia sp. JUb26]ROR15068.1 ribonuclease [Erwinia sp. JUb26]